MERSPQTTRDGDVRVEAGALTSFCSQALVAAGLSADDSSLASRVMVRTDLRGVHTHGVRLLPGYVRQLQKGGANPQAQLEVIADTDGVVVVNGQSGLGMVTAAKAEQIAGDRALKHGLACVLVRGGNHFGAAGHYALELAERGLFAVVMSNAPANMTVTGSRSSVLSNAPIAYACPAGTRPPIVFDIALSAVAGSKVIMAAERGEAVPEGWFVDESGSYNPDPRTFVTADGKMLGTLVPMAGHKGYGLALLVELLAGALSGAAMTRGVPSWARHPSTPGDTGHAIIALDPGAFLVPESFLSRVQALVDEIESAPRAPGTERILLPGRLEYEHELDSLEHGVALETVVWGQLERLASRLSLLDALELARIG